MSVIKRLEIFLLFIYILTTVSCKSDLSSEMVEDISLIGANIEINQNPTNKTDNGIVIDLFDDKQNRISNDSIEVIVNNIDVKIHHKQGLYYNDESSYSFSNIPVNEMYSVEIKLSDAKKYFLGSVKALAEENTNNIECVEKVDLNKNTIIKWKDLKDIDELSIMTSTLLKTSTDKEKNYDYRPEIIQKISSSGSYIFSKNDYSDPKSIISGLELKFRTTKFGKMNPKLLGNSKMTISTSIEKTIDFEE
jgi:hypothetical protein